MREKKSLGWMQWMKGWCCHVVHEILLQRLMASHLQNPLPLPPLNHITCIVTGSTSGIGLQTAKQLAEAGAHVVMAVRNTNIAHHLVHQWQIKRCVSNSPLNIEVMEVDLLSLESVVRFSKAWNQRFTTLDVLINNAGIFNMGGSQKFSKDGYEHHLQVNHLGPALLSLLLLPSLMRASSSRIINVNSVMHYVGFVDPDDLNLVSGTRSFSSFIGYSSSKLAQVMFSNELFKRLPSKARLSIVNVSPGAVITNVTRDLPMFLQHNYSSLAFFAFSPQEGSRSSLFSATDPLITNYTQNLIKTMENKTFCAFISPDCRLIKPSEEAQKVETAERVWEKTLELIGVPHDVLDKVINGEEVKCCYDKRKVF